MIKMSVTPSTFLTRGRTHPNKCGYLNLIRQGLQLLFSVTSIRRSLLAQLTVFVGDVLPVLSFRYASTLKDNNVRLLSGPLITGINLSG